MPDQQSVTENYAAIIDIGSNAVRLVIYDGLNRAPFRVHSERTICNLGTELAMTGYLNADSVKKALDSLSRFSGLLTAMKIKNVRTVATAAVRDARDGYNFVNTVQKELGLKITVIDGEEEARLSALGVLANGLGGNGVIGDYGGGSLELIVVEDGKVRHKASLPLGSHRLLAERSRPAQINMIEKHLESVDFLKNCAGKDFYAMGGAWRSMALAHIHMTDYPLRLLDHYQIDGKTAAEFADLVAKQKPAELEKKVGMSQKRIRDMSVAALTMEKLFKKTSPRNLIFSGTGLREGLVFDQLKASLREEDALIASCKKIAPKVSQSGDAEAFNFLFEWLKPLFGKEHRCLLEASCLLSDISWFEHEDYQAPHAFERILVLPLYGIDHAGRAFLALSQYVRYRGYLNDEMTAPIQALLDKKMLDLAILAGLAQRLGHLLTGGMLTLLEHAEFKVTPRQLVLKLDKRAAAFHADVISEGVAALAEKMKREAVVELLSD